MKKHICNYGIVVVLFFSWISSFSQAPAGYYDNAYNLTGEELRTALFNIIKNHTTISYGDLWDAFEDTDRRSDGKVWDMYSNCNFTFGSNQCGNYRNVCDCYNREHSFPKSWFNDAMPMYSDLFHLYPTDGKTNGMRSNYPYGEVGSGAATWGTGKLGSARYGLGYAGTVFEPADEYKGDFARSYFYMLTRYRDKISNWSSDMLSGNNFTNWAIEMLLEWHRNDPVSQKEINRNNAVYSYQHNRNPFIDNPEFADMIWDPDFEAEPGLTITSPENGVIVSSDFVEISFYTTNFIIGDEETEGKVEYSLNDVFVNYTTTSPVIISNLNAGLNKITLQLVDNSNQPLDPVVKKELNITYSGVGLASNFSMEKLIEVYPNPVKGEFRIGLSSVFEISSVVITDISGKAIYTDFNFNIDSSINIDNKAGGIYFAIIRLNTGETYSEKIILIK